MYTEPRLASGELGPIELFRERLSIVQANTSELLDEVFRLRYQVYCLERSFENVSDYPDRRERDDDDSRSAHSLLLFRSAKGFENTAVGTVRLILPRRGTDLPVFKLLSDHERRNIDIPWESTAEVSRFAVPRGFRRCLEKDLGYPPQERAKAVSSTRRVLNLLNFWLIRAVTTMAAKEGMTHIVAMMEPPLLRLIWALGIPFHPTGQMVEHHGLRQPGWAAMANTDHIRRYRPDLWELAFHAEWASSEAPALAQLRDSSREFAAHAVDFD